MPVVIDPQISGAFDDGSADGVVKAKIVRNNLVPIPFRNTTFGASGTSLGVGITPTFGTNLNSVNSDGTFSFVTLSTVPDPNRLGTGDEMWFRFSGRVVGVRYRVDPNQSTYDGTTGVVTSDSLPNFCVMIDGVCYHVSNTVARSLKAEGYQLAYEGKALIADDLPDGDHVGAIFLSGDASIPRQLVLFGLLVDQRAGYQPSARETFMLSFGFYTPPPTSNLTVGAATTGGAVDIGQHYYAHTNVASGVESPLSVGEPITISGGTQTVPITVPVGPAGTTSRNVYRTHAGASSLSTNYWLVGTIADNTTTVLPPDAASDASLTPLWQATRYPGALTTAPGNYIHNAGANSLPQLGIRTVMYYNRDSVPHTITITIGNGGPVISQLVLQPAGTAGCTAAFDPLGMTTPGSGGNSPTIPGAYFHYADAGNVINFAVLGGL